MQKNLISFTIILQNSHKSTIGLQTQMIIQPAVERRNGIAGRRRENPNWKLKLHANRHETTTRLIVYGYEKKSQL